MDINGPMRIGVLETDGASGREQLLDSIVSGKLALNEIIKVQVEQSTAVLSLSDLLNTRP